MVWAVVSATLVYRDRPIQHEEGYLHSKWDGGFNWSAQKQCLKLRVHPAPGVHALAAGCMHFDTYEPGEWVSAPYFRVFLYST